MIGEIREKAYAKVNFGLKVLPKREDGFHDIESIFQTVDLYDELIVTFSEEKGCSVTCDVMELPQKNTLTVSYQAFCEITGIVVPGVNVHIKKGIPSGGGLGGGSSDAAALMRVLEKYCGIKLTEKQREYISAKTGSDVFFFMECDSEGKGCALVSGRGEIIEKIVPRKDLFLLLVFPGFSSSTKEAYELVDEYLSREKRVDGPEISELENIYNGSVKQWSFINTFTVALSQKYKELTDSVEALRKVGCEFVQMSGSGSTVYGVFTLEQQAKLSSNLLAESLNCKLARVI